MATHILSLTYASKIPLVKSGECTQTVRLHNPDKPKRVGDKLILHTWEGKPYRSRWDWRLETEISELHLLTFQPEPVIDGAWRPSSFMDDVARQDGIMPVSASELYRILEHLNGLHHLGNTLWDIIRWPKPTIRRVE
jgi:hypothetical protein